MKLRLNTRPSKQDPDPDATLAAFKAIEEKARKDAEHLAKFRTALEASPVSPELLALWARVLEAPFRYRLTDLETQTTWALNLRDGRLVPERELPCAQPLMVPVRAESQDASIIGDATITVWPNDPRYAREKALLDRREEILNAGRAARKRKRN